MDISIIVPVYNGEATLCDLVKRLQGTLDEVASAWELILVNDGSVDHSWDVIRQLSCEYAFVRPVNLVRNYGQHNALLCGIRMARHDVTITLDDDLQNPPEEIPKLLRKLEQGFDVVYGTPLREQHGLWRDLASQITKLVLQRAMGAETARNTSSFRAFRTCLRNAFAAYRGTFVSIDVLLTWGTNKFVAIPVSHSPRLACNLLISVAAPGRV